ncbi:MAG: type III-A CRISPR-associated RAMP protein Csm3 [Candidatus Tectimicrobiota bacterium]|nr:MAG: type III-A CRISPR-associated RAMP protein Csm3 [Candidatus Tectomicrobia bacterium]
MASLTLKGKVIISGSVEAVTGLHIGGAAAGLDIGGIDNPIIRHPVSREPYIPGSSLRGKMRSLLDRHFGNEANHDIRREEPKVRVHVCDNEDKYSNCAVCQIFGVTPGERERRSWSQLKPARLLVRDVHLAADHEATERLRRAKTDLPFTEVKWEAAIDRITSAAVPRQNERVPAGAIFAPFELVYGIYALNGQGWESDVAWLQYVFKAMELLEDDYLGGYGSRGAGKIAFRNIHVVCKPHGYYEGKKGLETLAENLTVAELQPQAYAERIQKLLQE